MVDGISSAVSFQQAHTEVGAQLAALDKALEAELEAAQQLIQLLDDVGQNIDVVA